MIGLDPTEERTLASENKARKSPRDVADSNRRSVQSNLKTGGLDKDRITARESNPLPTRPTIGAHASGFGGRLVRHVTGNRSTVVRIHVEAGSFHRGKVS